jgi:TolA-binding protein
MRLAGWCVDHTISMPEDALRTAFKLTWNGVLGLDTRRELAPTLDEMRALYMFYLRHPHAPEAVRDRLEAARRTAGTAQACAALDAGEEMAAETWRIEKIRKLGAIDPAYPTAFALGVAQFRHGSFEAAAESFRDWLRAHPEGAYTLRARNHLRAALIEAGLR